jgi:hypothetical protein
LRVFVVDVDTLPEGTGSQCLHTKVYADGRSADRGRILRELLHLQGDEPPAGSLRDSRGEYVKALALREQVSSLLEPDPTKARQLDARVFDVD